LKFSASDQKQYIEYKINSRGKGVVPTFNFQKKLPFFLAVAGWVGAGARVSTGEVSGIIGGCNKANKRISWIVWHEVP
jgi:hypothetical protein